MMNNLLILLLGSLILTTFGWVVLVNVEGKTPVLGRYERMAWGMILGTTLSMLLVFLVHIAGIVSLTRTGFAVPILGVIIILGIVGWKRGVLWPSDLLSPDTSLPSGMLKIGLVLLLVWTGIKLLAGGYQIWNVPTYWDDSFNNWNMRGKVFFVEERLELEFDIGNEEQQTLGGVSSYPPTVPLAKTWLSALRGAWQEPIVNGIHFVWFLALIVILGRRIAFLQSRTRSWLAVYALVSLPLVLIHGTNPYADVFVSAHVLLSVIALYHIGVVQSDHVRAWTWLSALSVGALIFTKNEALLLYAPLLTALLLWQLWRRKEERPHAEWVRLSVTALVLIGLIALPWLAFKWMNGLTFGNAKSVGDTTFGFSLRALQAVWFSLTTEPNLMLLPIVMLSSLVLLWRQMIERSILALTVFLFGTLCLQFCLFIFIPTLGTEAIKQTGLARGMVQLAPSLLFFLFLVWEPKQSEAM